MSIDKSSIFADLEQIDNSNLFNIYFIRQWKIGRSSFEKYIGTIHKIPKRQAEAIKIALERTSKDPSVVRNKFSNESLVKTTVANKYSNIIHLADWIKNDA